MSASPAVTVVTVTYNDLEGLRRTVASVRSQTLADVQHVIVDGGSTDGTVAWLAGADLVADTTVVSEPDDGIYDAMNKGLARSSGTLVTFLNAGDSYVHPDVLASAAARFSAGGWDWGFGAAQVVDGTGRPVRRVLPAAYGWARHAFSRNTIVHQTVFARTSVLRELGGFDLRFRIAADFHATLRLGRRSRPGLWSEVDVSFLTGGLSDRKPWRALWDMHRARCDVLGLRAAGAAADAGWTALLLAYVLLRRQLKAAAGAVLGPRAVSWWARLPPLRGRR